MNGSFDLASGKPLQLDGRRLSIAKGIDRKDEVTLECGDRVVHVQTSDFYGADDHADYWCQPNRYCIVASHSGNAVIRVDLDLCSVEEVAHLDRPVVSGYDPGGLQWVRFIDTPAGLALVTESSAMLFDETGALAWRRHHGALGATVTLSPGGILNLRDDAGDFGFLADGSMVRYSQSNTQGLLGEPSVDAIAGAELRSDPGERSRRSQQRQERSAPP